MKDHLKIINSKEMEKLNIQMVLNSKDNLKTMFDKGKEKLLKRTVRLSKANGKIIFISKKKNQNSKNFKNEINDMFVYLN